MIMKHISGRAHDVCVLARGRDGPDCWLWPPDPPHPSPISLPCVPGTMWHVKKGFGAWAGGGGVALVRGEGKPPQARGKARA